MSVLDELDKLRATLPGCTLVAFGDLGAKIVLCASADKKRPQEALDALCMSASAALDGDFAQPAATHLNATRLDQAVTVGPGEIHLFLRSHLDPCDALFCSFADQTDIIEIVTAGRKALDKISQPQ